MPRISQIPTNDEYLLLADAYKNSGRSTQSAYRSNYFKMYNALNNREIHTVSETAIINAVDALNIKNVNTKSALLNIAVVVRRLPEYELKVSKLVIQREKLREVIIEHTKTNNDAINLPSYSDIVNHMDSLYTSGDYRGYIINYLLIHFQTRNQDLNFTIVSNKRDMNGIDKNFLWLNIKKKMVVYKRSMYKTNKIYGSLIQEITDKKFITALKAISRLQDKKDPKGTFIKNVSSLAGYVMKYTLNGLGESKYVKIIINHFKNDLQALTQISTNRGTSIATLIAFYDINNNNNEKPPL